MTKNQGNTFEQSGQYVSRAGHKLASVGDVFELNFTDKVVLDVGSSTGGFTDFALRSGARKVIAVDSGTHQLHASLRGDPRIILIEKTDILDVAELPEVPDMVLIDVSFISLRKILPHILKLAGPFAQIVAMLKPQFESSAALKHRGVIKNERMRREILGAFEIWARKHFVILNKADSEVAGSKGNLERFYLLKIVSNQQITK